MENHSDKLKLILISLKNQQQKSKRGAVGLLKPGGNQYSYNNDLQNKAQNHFSISALRGFSGEKIPSAELEWRLSDTMETVM